LSRRRRIARFTQLDPLTWEYPELTNYQYASDEPIANVDMDGLEKYLSLEPIVFKVTLKSTSKASNIATKVIERLSLITARGVSDALVNANTFGLSDLMGNNHLYSYEDPEEQVAYLRGRLGGDAIAAAQGSTEVDGGAGAVLSTGVETAGVGAAAGLVVGLHGAGIGATAAYDVSWALEKLYRLNASASSSADGRTSPQEKKFEPLANTKAGKEAVEQSRLPKGFKKTKEFGKQHGQEVYKKGNRYYSKDIDEHNIKDGWKVFRKIGNRLVRIGTADKDLKIFKK